MSTSCCFPWMHTGKVILLFLQQPCVQACTHFVTVKGCTCLSSLHHGMHPNQYICRVVYMLVQWTSCEEQSHYFVSSSQNDSGNK